jgi:hypothetical protein
MAIMQSPFSYVEKFARMTKEVEDGRHNRSDDQDISRQ